MHLEQGDKSVQDYYGEIQKGLMRCGIVEGTEDSIVIFTRVCSAIFRT
jgi:hypothetical protein